LKPADAPETQRTAPSDVLASVPRQTDKTSRTDEGHQGAKQTEVEKHRQDSEGCGLAADQVANMLASVATDADKPAIASFVMLRGRYRDRGGKDGDQQGDNGGHGGNSVRR
jgi:hypothetical protein